MSCIRMEDLGGLGALDAMTKWRGVDFTVNSRQSIWLKKDSLIDRIESVVSGRFFISIDREDETTTRKAFFIARFEDDADAAKVAEELGGELRRAWRPLTPEEQAEADARLGVMREQFLASAMKLAK